MVQWWKDNLYEYLLQTWFKKRLIEILYFTDCVVSRVERQPVRAHARIRRPRALHQDPCQYPFPLTVAVPVTRRIMKKGQHITRTTTTSSLALIDPLQVCPFAMPIIATVFV